jgi:hypothetical protein
VVRNISDHPVCASKVASQLFLIAQPPLWRRGIAAALRLTRVHRRGTAKIEAGRNGSDMA